MGCTWQTLKQIWVNSILIRFVIKFLDLVCGIIALQGGSILILMMFFVGFPPEIINQVDYTIEGAIFVGSYVLWFYGTLLLLFFYQLWLYYCVQHQEVRCERYLFYGIPLCLLRALMHDYLMMIGFPLEKKVPNKGWYVVNGYFQFVEIVVDIFRSIFLINHQNSLCSFCGIVMIISIVFAGLNIIHTISTFLFFLSQKKPTQQQNHGSAASIKT